MPTSVQATSRPSAGTVRTPRIHKKRTPVEQAYDRLCADPRLSSDAKTLAGRLLLYCLADLNVALFTGTLQLAADCGWAGLYVDLGKDRTLAALAELEAEGYIARLGSKQFWRWFKAEGAPKFGVMRPPVESSCRRFIVLLWKFLGSRPDFGPSGGSAGATRGPTGGVAGATHEEAPALPPGEAPAPPAMNGSKFEPPKGTENGNVTALSRGGGEPPPSAPTEEAIADMVAMARNRNSIVRNAALWQLEDCDRLPAEFAGKVPARPPVPRPEEAPPVSSPPSLTPAELLVNRVRNLARGGPLLADDVTIEELAMDVAFSIMDAHSQGLHRAVLRELASKQVHIDHYLTALRKGRQAPLGEGGAAFGRFIKPYRPGARGDKAARRQ